MAIKLKDLDRFLVSGKMGFDRREESRHTGYVVRMGNARLGLPTLLRVSHGGGDAALNNIKGVAQALGLNVKELQTAEKCHISRECILLMLSVHMLDFAVNRRAMLRDKDEGEAGIRAMVESVKIILAQTPTLSKKAWTGEELKAFGRVRHLLQQWEKEPLTAEAAKAIISHTSRG
ncbi:hypothetical protein KBB96_09645 [Luteolibacter ambystomatis]|uniref:Uncharacterized protein n=1 Tax=Luteolibacter ambystomatis TaxID=2824561 RepID=A0A975J320_9BACT|nr:hypothetical protein [Luteolibacter ambystomatis]QUE53143.1 hypothetical protein KBB96_09645 [Luteolibacter ambystomatis]